MYEVCAPQALFICGISQLHNGNGMEMRWRGEWYRHRHSGSVCDKYDVKFAFLPALPGKKLSHFSSGCLATWAGAGRRPHHSQAGPCRATSQPRRPSRRGEGLLLRLLNIFRWGQRSAASQRALQTSDNVKYPFKEEVIFKQTLENIFP